MNKITEALKKILPAEHVNEVAKAVEESLERLAAHVRELEFDLANIAAGDRHGDVELECRIGFQCKHGLIPLIVLLERLDGGVYTAVRVTT